MLLKEISGSYKGECLEGLAEGKGRAKGDDVYEGSFHKGLPEGKGEYTYKNGSVYSGEWKNGLKHGKGKFKYEINGKSTTLAGYWVDGDYKGPQEPEEDYRVTNKTAIDQYMIKRVDSHENVVEISFEQLMNKYVPHDLSVTVTSGNYQQQNQKMVLMNYTLPLECGIHYTIRTAGGDWQCNFMFQVYKTGKYSVLLINN